MNPQNLNEVGPLIWTHYMDSFPLKECLHCVARTWDMNKTITSDDMAEMNVCDDPLLSGRYEDLWVLTRYLKPWLPQRKLKYRHYLSIPNSFGKFMDYMASIPDECICDFNRYDWTYNDLDVLDTTLCSNINYEKLKLKLQQGIPNPLLKLRRLRKNRRRHLALKNLTVNWFRPHPKIEFLEEKIERKSIIKWHVNHGLSISDKLCNMTRLIHWKPKIIGRGIEAYNFEAITLEDEGKIYKPTTYPIYEEQGVGEALSDFKKKMVSKGVDMAVDAVSKAEEGDGTHLGVFAEFSGVLKGMMERYDIATSKHPDASFSVALDRLSSNGLALKMDNKVKMSLLEKVGAVISLIVSIIIAPSIYHSLNNITTYLLQAGFGSNLIQWFEGNQSGLEKMFSRVQCLYRSEGYEEQSVDDYADLIAPGASLIATLVCAITTTDDNRKLPKFAKCGQFANSFNNIKTMSGAVKESLLLGRKMVIEASTGLPFDLEELEEVHLELENWFIAIERTIHNASFLADYPTNLESPEVLEELLSIGNRLLMSLDRITGQGKQGIVWRIQEGIRQLKKALEISVAIRAKPTNRVEPVMVVLQGPTGVGKTTMISRLALDLYDKFEGTVSPAPTCPVDLIYNKSPGSEYWDGYNYQFVTFLDEAFQSNSEEAERLDIDQVFQIVSPFSAPMNMAKLELKNKVFFKSPYVVMTTNAVNWDIFKVKSPDALKRRRSVVVVPRMKEEFAMSYDGQSGLAIKLDSIKWLRYCEEREINPAIPDYAWFDLIDPETDVEMQSGLSYDDLVVHINKIQNAKRKTFSRINMSLQETFETISKRKAYEEQGDITASQVLAKIESSLDTRKMYQFKGSDRIHPLLILVNLKCKCITFKSQTFELELAQESNVIKKLVIAFNELSRDKQLAMYINLCMLAKSSKVTYRRTIINKMTGIDVSNDMMEEGSIYDRLYSVSSDVKFPVYDWRTRTKGYFNSLKDDFPWKTVGGVFALLTIIVTSGGALYWWKTRSTSDSFQNIPTIESWKPKEKSKSGFKKWTPKRYGQAESSEELVIATNDDNKIKKVNKAYEEQALVDPNWESMLFVVKKNLVKCSLISSGSVLGATRGIIIRNDFLLLPLHLFKFSEGRSNIILKIVGPYRTVKFLVEDTTRIRIGNRWDYDDVVLLKCPDNKIVGADIVKYFIRSEEVDDTHDVYGELVVPGEEEMIRFGSRIFSQQKYIQDSGSKLLNLSVGGKYCKTGWNYVAATKKGDCGSPLVRWDNHAKTKILGLHVAGSTSDVPNLGCFATIVDQDWLLESIQKLGGGTLVEEGEEIIPPPTETHLMKPSMEVTTWVPHSKRVSLPNRTKIYKSEFQNRGYLWPPKTAPVDMSVKVDGPLSLALDKYIKEAAIVDSKKLSDISRSLYLRSGLGSPAHDRSIFSLEEALNVQDNLNSINITSSLGYPYVLNRNHKKKDLIVYNDKEQRFQFNGTLLLEDTENLERLCMEGKSPQQIWMVYMKDERKLISDVEKGKVRLFKSPPFPLVLLARKYFGSFMSALVSTKFQHGMMIGIDPHGSEWNTLARCLMAKNDIMLGEDYSNWDRTVPMEFLKQFFRWADLFYGFENKQHLTIRRSIEEAILSPVFQLLSFRYRVVSGNPSGSPFTAPMNSLANLLVTIYILSNQIGVSRAINNSYIATYGDDKLWACADKFDLDMYKEHMSELGLRITSSDKTSNLAFKPIEDQEFLKRGFRKISSVYRGLLRLDTIRESLLWVRGFKNQRLALEDTLRGALVEYGMYPPEEIVEDYIKIFSVCTDLGFQIDISTHMLLAFNTQEEMLNGSILESIVLMIGGAVWNQSLAYDKKIMTVVDVNELFGIQSELVVEYVWIDMALSLPILETGVFHHAGFRFGNQEYCYSDKGVIILNQQYTPSGSRRAVIDKTRFLEFVLRPRKYHKVYWNCLTWAEYVMDSYPQVYDPLSVKLREYMFAHQRNMIGEYTIQGLEEQGDSPLADNLVEIPEETKIEAHVVEGPLRIGSKPRSIEDLLEAEEIVGTQTWTINNFVDHEVIGVDFPQAIIDVPQFRQKLNFNAFMSGTLKIWMRVATTKFQCGKLLGVWIPAFDKGLAGGINLNVLAQTAMTHVLFDAATQNEVSLEIPFLNDQNAVRFATLQGNSYGRFSVKVLNPLRDPASEGVSVVVCANMIDVVVSVPSGVTMAGKNNGAANSVYPFYTAQGEAEEKVKEGIISGITTRVGGIARLLGRIPVFSGPAAWIAVISESVGTIAKCIGLSKPVSLESVKPVVPRLFSSINYKDALDMGQVLGTEPNNSVMIRPSLFGSNYDEMNIDYLAQIPQIIHQASWTRPAKVYDFLSVIPVTPIASARLPGGEAQLSVLGYVSLAAKYWRGDLRYKIQVVCSDMHRGALAILFNPVQILGQRPKLSTVSHIKMDLSVTREVDFVVPFVSDQLFHRVGSPFDSYKVGDHHATGFVHIMVLNKLVGPSTVTPNVQINIWLSAQGEYHLAVPTLQNIARLSYGKKPQQDELDMMEYISDFEEQALESKTNNLPILENSTDDPESVVMGETLYNIRDFLKIFVKKFSFDLQGTSGSMVIPAHKFLAQKSKDGLQDTYYDHFMRLFRFSRGTIRHKVAMGAFNVKLSVIATLDLDQDKTVYSWIPTDVLEGSPWATTFTKINPTLEYALPYYMVNKMIVHGQARDPRNVRLTIDILAGKVTGKIIGYEAIGDDFSAGYIMGPPSVFNKIGPVPPPPKDLMPVTKLIKAKTSGDFVPYTFKGSKVGRAYPDILDGGKSAYMSSNTDNVLDEGTIIEIDDLHCEYVVKKTQYEGTDTGKMTFIINTEFIENKFIWTKLPGNLILQLVWANQEVSLLIREVDSKTPILLSIAKGVSYSLDSTDTFTDWLQGTKLFPRNKRHVAYPNP